MRPQAALRRSATAPAEAQGPAMWPGRAGASLMGSDRHYPEEAPAHRVRVAAFRLDETTATNHAYATFLAATGHVTAAERPLDPATWPNAAPHELEPGSTAFHATPGPVDTSDFRHWWPWVPGACRRHPKGPGIRGPAVRHAQMGTPA